MDGTLRIVESQLPKCKSKNLEIISNLFLANEGGFLHPLTVPAGFFLLMPGLLDLGARHPWCSQVPA